MFFGSLLSLASLKFVSRRGYHRGSKNRRDRLEKLVNGFSKQIEDMVLMYQRWCFRMKDAGLYDGLGGISPPNDDLDVVDGTAQIILIDSHCESLYPMTCHV